MTPQDWYSLPKSLRQVLTVLAYVFIAYGGIEMGRELYRLLAEAEVARDESDDLDDDGITDAEIVDD